MRLGERFKNAWNVFRGRSPTIGSYYFGDSSRPDQMRISPYGIKSMVTSVYTQIAVDCSAIDIKHVRLREDGKFQNTINSSLNYALTKSANIDQTGRELIRDSVLKMFDHGTVAIVPVDTDINPENTDSYTIYTLRAGKITAWYPKHVLVELYNDETGEKKEVLVEKRYTAIIENPFYPVMNEPNSTAQQLMSTIAKLEEANNKQVGKINLLIKMPYQVKDALKRLQAERRRRDIEQQLVNNPYGIAYIDTNENAIQLNQPLENNLWEQAVGLRDQLFNELGFSKSIFDGTADEQTMLNYQNRTLEPIMSAITENMERKWISQTALTQGQAIRFFKNPFKLVPVGQIAEIADKFTRNEIMTSNEMRSVIGLEPIDDPKADELRNANLNHPDEEGTSSTVTEEIIEHHGIKGQQWGIQNGPPYPLKDYAKYGKELLNNSDKRNILKWGKDEDHNILYISGISGSGKSTLSNYLKDKNTEVVHLDSYFERKNLDTARNNRNHSFDDFLKKNNFDISVLEDDILFKENIREYFKNVDKFTKITEKYGQSMFKEDKKVIMEGVQIKDETLYDNDGKSFLKDKPYIELKTDEETSRKRAKERDKNI